MEKEKVRMEVRTETTMKYVTVEVDKNVFNDFLQSFAEAFAKEKKWYRFGSSSGKVIIEGITYGEIQEFFKK